MKDIMNKEIQCGDHVIVTVSKKSHYLTSAIVENIEDDGSIEIRYSSTVATKKLKPGEIVFKYDPKPFVLDGRLGLCKDCTSQVIESGSKVLYRVSSGVAFGIVSKVLDSLWVELENGDRVRNVGIFVL